MSQLLSWATMPSTTRSESPGRRKPTSRPVSVNTIRFTAANTAQNTPGWLNAAWNFSGWLRFRGSAMVVTMVQTCWKNSCMGVLGPMSVSPGRPCPIAARVADARPAVKVQPPACHS